MQEKLKQRLRNKLYSVLNETKLIKQGLKSIKILHEDFKSERKTIQCSIKLMIGQRKNNLDKNKQYMNINTEIDKENINTQNINCDYINQNKYEVVKNKNKYQNDKTRQRFKCANSNLKASIMSELSQIKSIEKKQAAAFKNYQRIKAHNSQHKKRRNQHSKSRQSLSKNSSSTFKHYLQNIAVKSQNIIAKPQQIQIPISLNKNPTTLSCRNGHIFYEGDLNQLNLPHGHGRLQKCCEFISNKIGGIQLNKTLYYQGQFHNGLFHGYGTLGYQGGVKYVGQFQVGERSGRGSLYLGGKVETAKWKNDKFIAVL